MKTSPTILAALIAIAAPLKTSAANLYWDPNGTTDGAGTTPTGTWNSTNTFWNSDPTGGAAGSLVGWTDTTNTAVFSAGSDATGGYTVTLGAAQTAGGLTIEEGAVTLAGSALTISGAGVTTINSGANLIISTTTQIAYTSGAGGTVQLNGGTLSNTNTGAGGTFFTANAGIVVGSAGGIVSVPNTGQILQYNGVISGTGNTLTKSGVGEFRALNNWTFGKLIVSQGLYRSQRTQQSVLALRSQQRLLEGSPSTLEEPLEEEPSW